MEHNDILRENFLSVKATMPNSITLVAVSKTKPIEDIHYLYTLGQRIFGENKVQELCDKFGHLPKDIQWHFIGKLQTNKVKYLVGKVALIHSLDSIKLAKEIEKQFAKENLIAHCLIQVNIGNDPNKSGIEKHELTALLEFIATCKYIKIQGFMTILPIVSKEETLHFFNALKALQQQYHCGCVNFKQCDFPILSMGMSDDYLDAIKCGATHVRVGSKLFGTR